MSLHTFTYLSAYSGPPLKGAINRDGSDNISMATPPLKKMMAATARGAMTIFLKNIYKHYSPPKNPLAPRTQGCV